MYKTELWESSRLLFMKILSDTGDLHDGRTSLQRTQPRVRVIYSGVALPTYCECLDRKNVLYMKRAALLDFTPKVYGLLGADKAGPEEDRASSFKLPPNLPKVQRIFNPQIA